MLYQFYDHQPPRRSWSFIQPINAAIHASSVFLSQTRTRSEFFFPGALCAEPVSIRPSWLATVPISHFWEAAIYSRLHWWVGGDHSYLLKLHLYPLGICLMSPSTKPSIPADNSLFCKHAAFASPNVVRIQSRADGFPCGMQIPRRQPSVP